MNSAEILIITHTPYMILAIIGIIGLRSARKKLEAMNQSLRRQQ